MSSYYLEDIMIINELRNLSFHNISQKGKKMQSKYKKAEKFISVNFLF